MKTNSAAPDYKGYRFPPEMISHAVWLYFRFSLSYRDGEELLAQRGIVVTYERFCQNSSNDLAEKPHFWDADLIK